MLGEHNDMSDAFHRDLMAESRADGVALRELGERLKALHGAITIARKTDFDRLLREFAALRDDFAALHAEDMSGRVDQRAHSCWRARARHLAASVVGLVEGVPGS